MSFWKKKDNIIIVGFVLAFFVGLGVWYDRCCVGTALYPGNSSGNAFEIPFTDQHQKQQTLSQFKGKPLIVNFWATWCPSCVKRMGTLNRFAEKFQAAGGEVLAISQDNGGLSAVRAYYARNEYRNLPIYIEASGLLSGTFGIRGLPSTIFIDAQGKEVGRLEGAVDWDSNEVQDLVNQYFGMNIS